MKGHGPIEEQPLRHLDRYSGHWPLSELENAYRNDAQNPKQG